MANEYKKTMNLPKTKFPMRAGLPQAEPKRLAAWEASDVYELARKKNAGHEKFILHDGPPYANGPIHLGHALNKIVKDIINRQHIMLGNDVVYVPGWDCHGQPIEHKVEQHLGTKEFNETPVPEVRELCQKFAVENIDLQKQGFRRLGVLADWAHPYLTLSHDHDAADIEVFKAIYDTGAVYHGRKPVHWCSHCHTALSEAEIEYADVTGPSLFVAYRTERAPEALAATGLPVNIAVWTTTPWTLPANATVALKPEATYVALEHDGQAYIVMDARADAVADAAGWEPTLVTIDGEPWSATAEELLSCTYHQPIFPEEVRPVIEADFVTTDNGTGIVHVAPGHGADDYYAGVANDIPIVMPVDDDGRFYEGTGWGSGGPWSGMSVDEANPKIIQWLSDQGTLIAAGTIEHSYPHCWRCKNPVIFRATEQWFVSMDSTGLREEALKAIDDDVTWYPGWTINRIRSMVEGRPDWCLSRQRVWGVPIPSYTCRSCGATVMNDATLDAVIALFHEKGSDAWFTDDPASYLGDACVCPECGGHDLVPDKDILDVWWDSGVSHTAVLKGRFGLRYPADLYVEGSDQHRGWFQSSLLTSVGAYGRPPYDAVLTLGFTLDGQGRKMSKSLGNTVDPNLVCDRRGADIIRLWVTSVDSTADMPCDEQILDQVAGAYRKIRNTIRFLLGELEGQFQPGRDGLPVEELVPFDRAMLAKACAVHREVEKAYAEYRFNAVYRALYDFVVDVSNFYLDATKDRTYCDMPAAMSRRSAQTVWCHMLSMLLRDFQPILSYTCDELMAYVPEELTDGQTYAALLDWWQPPMSVEEQDAELPVYEALSQVRDAFTQAYEEASTAGRLAAQKKEAAHAHVTLTPQLAEALEPVVGNLAEAFVCATADWELGEELAVEVSPAAGEMCERCRIWREVNENHLCDRCQEAVDAYEGNQ
ncbi:isoleucine--tRNA ligase [Olsenella sp. YH-ols2217]|uniref:Isoleucine--tRNA ligase n=1 Tax=Kribbibacterium absianum TaxID=3044210 RepID=A0ABT6ZIG7_9ACTN|nr:MULTISPECIES: isoleucine--tRNA ligase [unclassified Olsenella]MDJ1121361.1 isoleucine--tRNA ligase [Olsenella sp. YH-ols2216]MDJ1128851.1 isoleucine--tRNA ligase [Olsenella sp. YH-ols2217]